MTVKYKYSRSDARWLSKCPGIWIVWNNKLSRSSLIVMLFISIFRFVLGKWELSIGMLSRLRILRKKKKTHLPLGFENSVGVLSVWQNLVSCVKMSLKKGSNLHHSLMNGEIMPHLVKLCNILSEEYCSCNTNSTFSTFSTMNVTVYYSTCWLIVCLSDTINESHEL